MKPIKFKEMNGVVAKDQAQYIPLPMFRDDFNVISCWKLSVWERVKVLFTGVVWLKLSHPSRLHFITPSKLTVDTPFKPMGVEDSELDNNKDVRLLHTASQDFLVAFIIIGLVVGGIYAISTA